MNRGIRQEVLGPLPLDAERSRGDIPPTPRPPPEKTREERFAEAQAKILETYAETFRRLAE